MDRKKLYVLLANEQMADLSEDKDEIDHNSGKAYRVPPKLMSPYLAGFRESKRAKKEVSTKSFSRAMEESRKAKLAQAIAHYDKLAGAAKAKEAEEEKLKLAGFWGTPVEAAASSAAAADPDPLGFAAYGSQSRVVAGPALRLKARAVRLTPREPHFRLVPRLRPDSAGFFGGRRRKE